MAALNVFSFFADNLIAISAAVILTSLGYVAYQQYFHPLSIFPGPFLASLTDLWQVLQFLAGQQPYNLTELHEKHGSIVRYGPNKLSVTSEDVIRSIYIKNSRIMPKTEYYNPSGRPDRPNLFNTIDIEVYCHHSLL